MSTILASSIGCARAKKDPSLEDWLSVLEKKRALSRARPTLTERQAYLDSLGDFVAKHPTHGRARGVYERVQLEFARDLAGAGRLREAIRFYRSVLHRNPGNLEARTELIETIERLSVSRAKLDRLRRGMSKAEVARQLGKPLPGWTRSVVKRHRRSEAWYYPAENQKLASVHFSDGRLLTAELDSGAPLIGISTPLPK